MEKIRRFHPVYALTILKKPAILCVVPLLAALRRFDLEALLRAAEQELVLIAVLLVLGVLLWRKAGWSLREGTLYWQGSFFGPTLTGSLRPNDLACVALRRCWYLRPIGAVRLELGLTTGGSAHLYLSRRAAEELMAQLLPVPEETKNLTPGPADKAVLALLNCDVVAAVTLLAVSLRNIRELLGRQWVQELARQSISTTTALLGRWLPGSLAVLAGLLFLLAGVTLALAFLRTVNYTLRLGEGVMIASGGLLSPTRWVVRQSAIVRADLRLTPVARLSGRIPLFITAGGYTGTALTVCRSLDDPRLKELVPGAAFPAPSRQPLRGRSAVAYLLVPAICLGLSLLAYNSFYRLPLPVPEIKHALALPAVLCFGWLWVSGEGFLRDTAALTDEGLPTACTTRWFTHHLCCLLLCPSATVFANPLSQRVGRGNLYLHQPYRGKVKVISLPLETARAVAENYKEKKIYV